MSDTVKIYCNDLNGYHERRGLSWISTFTHNGTRWKEVLIPRGSPSTGDDAQEYQQTSRYLVDHRGMALFRAVYKRAPKSWPDMRTPRGFFDPRTRDGASLILVYEDVVSGREYPDGIPSHNDVFYLFECGCGTSGRVPEDVLFRGLDPHIGKGQGGLTIGEVAEWA